MTKTTNVKREEMEVTETTIEYSQDDVRIALIDLEAELERLSGAKWIVLNPTAKNMVNGEFLDLPITIGLESKELTRDRLLTFETYFKGFVLIDNKYVGVIRNIPIEIVFVGNDYDFMKNPSTIRYENAYYLIPNPFEEYDKVWKQVK